MLQKKLNVVDPPETNGGQTSGGKPFRPVRV